MEESCIITLIKTADTPDFDTPDLKTLVVSSINTGRRR